MSIPIVVNYPPVKSSKPISEILSRIKDFLDIFQKLALIVLFIIILFDHQRVGKWATETPFRAVLGVELKSKEEREELLASEQERNKQIQEVIKKLKVIEQNVPQEDAQQIQQPINTLIKINSRISENIKSIDQKQISDTVYSEINEWLVIFGADKTISAAQDEIDIAKTKQFDNSIILKRDGWYRSVIRFDNKIEAQTQLKNIQTKLREGSYIRDLNTWCPDWTSTVKTDGEYKYYQCKD